MKEITLKELTQELRRKHLIWHWDKSKYNVTFHTVNEQKGYWLKSADTQKGLFSQILSPLMQEYKRDGQFYYITTTFKSGNQSKITLEVISAY